MSNFELKLEQWHPGAAHYDAQYSFVAAKDGEVIAKTGYGTCLLYCEDTRIKINGMDVLVPFEVRQEQKDIVIFAVPNDYANQGFEGTASYTLRFNCALTKEPTFFDDFDTFDTDKWEVGWEYNGIGGYVENSNLVFKMDDECQKHCRVISTAHSFAQTFGSFTARIKVPGYNNTAQSCACDFWLCSNVLHPETGFWKENPAYPREEYREHMGEIDIMEYSPAFGDYTTASLHYYGWVPGRLRSSGMGNLHVPGIREGYHDISVTWVPGGIYWYYDGKLTRAYDTEDIAEVGVKEPADMVVLLQACKPTREHWVGKPLPQDKSEDLIMYTDWVRVYGIKK